MTWKELINLLQEIPENHLEEPAYCNNEEGIEFEINDIKQIPHEGDDERIKNTTFFILTP